jgi:hypothetical protein
MDDVFMAAGRKEKGEEEQTRSIPISRPELLGIVRRNRTSPNRYKNSS